MSPSAQTSVAGVSSRRHCSGAMYGGVPRNPMVAPPTSCVAGVISGASRCASPLTKRAMPKSSTRGRPSAPSSTFAGLRSRCRMPAAWAASTACATASPMRSASVRPGQSSRIRCASVLPSTYSSATQGSPSCSPTS